jgi:F-type H+-transporting ATPase subunit alpha
MFASDLDAASKPQLERGQRLMELLKQPQYSPLAVEDQVVVRWAGTTGKLDDVPVEDIRRFETELLDYLRRNTSRVLASIASTGKLGDDPSSSSRPPSTTSGRTVRDLDGSPLTGADLGDARDRGRAGADRPAEEGLTMAGQQRVYRASHQVDPGD